MISTNTYDSKRLQNVSLRYSPGNMINGILAPTVPVKNQSGKIMTYGSDHLRIVNTIKAEGASGYIMDSSVSVADHYFIEDHQIGEYIAKEVLDNAENPLKPKIDTTENLMDVIALGKEYALATSLTDTSVLTNYTTLSGTSQWSDYNNSDPLDDITTGIASVRDNAFGKIVNTMSLGWAVMQKLMYHPDIVAMFPGAQVITKDQLASALGSIFGIQDVIVGSAVYNSAAKGVSATKADVWGKNVILAYIEPRPTLKSRTLAYTYAQKVNREVSVKPLNSDSKLLQMKAMYIQVNEAYDQVIVDSNCGYLITAAVA